MGKVTEISWCDSTWNGWRGCQHAELGCDHCYAETGAKRNPKTLGIWGADGKRVRGVDVYWQLPLKWNAEAEAAGVRARVFALSLGDVFEDWRGPIHATNGNPLWWCHGSLSNSPIPSVGLEDGCRLMTMDECRRDLFELIDRTPWLDWLLVTKRPQNARRMWSTTSCQRAFDEVPYRANVWLLTSISDQPTADALVPELLKCRDLVPVLGLSIEPLLGPVDLDRWIWGNRCPDPQCRDSTWDHACELGQQMLDWVIVGGESQHGARPLHPAWPRSIRDQCQDAGVPFFFKQWGEYAPDEALPKMQPGDSRKFAVVKPAGGDRIFRTDGKFSGDSPHQEDAWMYRVGKKAAGRLLDGRTWDEFPKVSVPHA